MRSGIILPTFPLFTENHKIYVVRQINLNLPVMEQVPEAQMVMIWVWEAFQAVESLKTTKTLINMWCISDLHETNHVSKKYKYMYQVFI